MPWERLLVSRLGSVLALTVVSLAVAVPARSQDPNPVRHALLIGINRYTAEIAGVPELSFAVSDARALRDVLEERGWDEENVAVVLDDEASRRRIIKEMDRLAKQVRQQDVVLIYFAGHGVRDKTGREHTYWLTYPSTLEGLAVDGMRLSHLLEYVDDIPADRKILILDHCHSGDIQRVSADGETVSRGVDGELRLTRNLFPREDFRLAVEQRFARGLVVLGSARDDAYEFADIGHGMFTYGLLEALNNPATDGNTDGQLTLGELWQEAQRVMNEVAAAKGVTQIPIEIERGEGLLTWNFIDAPVTTALEAAREADELEEFLGQLDAETQLDIRVRIACLQALRAWEEAKAQDLPVDSINQAIVGEIKSLRELGGQVSSEDKKQALEFKLHSLGVV